MIVYENTDRLYKPAIEGLTVAHLVALDSIAFAKGYTDEQLADLGFIYDNEPLLDSLQAIHDKHSPTIWRAQLADAFNLDKRVLA